MATKADKMVFRALKTAVEKDQLRLYMDYGKVNRPGSPIYNPWECLLPILIPVLIGLMLIILVGVIFGLLFIVAMIMVYSTYFKKKLYHKVIERTKAYLISSYENCENLWKFGGIVLVNAENKKLGCVAPEGDWKEFVILNFSDYMLDKKTEETKKDEKAPTYYLCKEDSGFKLYDAEGKLVRKMSKVQASKYTKGALDYNTMKGLYSSKVAY